MALGYKMNRRHSRAAAMIAIAAGTLVVAACTGSTNGPTSSPGGTSSGNVSPGAGLAAVTPAGTKPVSSVVWATNRDVISLDPIFSAAYPEYTADSLMCESLLRQAPDGSLQPGLATVSNPSPTTLVFTLRPGVKFWDGHPVTSADVVYSLDRAANPELGGYYSGRLDRIASVTATSPTQVTVKLTQPHYWLEAELASMPGIIIEKSFAEKEGKNYGTPAGSIMCTGAYMLQSWTPGVGVVAVRNPHYWNPSVHPLVGQITLKGVLGNLNVRRALSLALNRQGIINSVYQGAAQLPRWVSNPGTFGYAQSVFARAYDSSPVLTQNIAAARKLVQQAGDTGKTITFGTTSQLAVYAGDTAAYQATAQAIGLKVALKSVSAQDYIDFLVSPQFRAGVDAFPGVDFGDYADPAALLGAFVPGGSENWDNFNSPPITAALEQARGTASPDQRAARVARVEELTMQQQPWIPDVEPDTVLVLGQGLTGVFSSTAYLFSPWTDRLGGTG